MARLAIFWRGCTINGVKKRSSKPAKVRPAGVRLQNAHQDGLEAQAQLNRIEAFKLKVEGHSVREIATKLGVAVSTAHGYLFAEATELSAKETKARETYKSVEDQRLTALMKRALPIATKDNLVVIETEMTADGPMEVRKEDAELQLKAIAQVIKISERLSRLHGLDAPSKQEHTGADGGPIQYALTKERQAQLADKGRRLLAMMPKSQPEAIIVGDN